MDGGAARDELNTKTQRHEVTTTGRYARREAGATAAVVAWYREGPTSNDRVRVDEGPNPLHNVDQEIVIVELRDQRHLAITVIQ